MLISNLHKFRAPFFILILLILLFLPKSISAHNPTSITPNGINTVCSSDHTISESDESGTIIYTCNHPTEAIFNIPNLSPFEDLGGLLNDLLTLIFFVAGIAFFVNLLIGGIQWISAGGDPKAIDAARGRLTSALIGLVIVVSAYAVALIIQTVLGITIVSGYQF